MAVLSKHACSSAGDLPDSGSGPWLLAQVAAPEQDLRRDSNEGPPGPQLDHESVVHQARRAANEKVKNRASLW
jgi:hypothetical protein